MAFNKIRKNTAKFLNAKSKDVASVKSKEVKIALAKLEKTCAIKAEEAKTPYTEANSAVTKAQRELNNLTITLDEAKGKYESVVKSNNQKLVEARNLVKVTMEHDGIRSAIAKSLTGLAQLIK